MNKLLVVGLLIILVGMALVVLGSASQGSVSVGGFILIGPFPIVFGTGTNSGQLAALALAVGLLMLVLVSVLAWRLASGVRDSSRRNA
jgi:uncharacterized membrane protein